MAKKKRKAARVPSIRARPDPRPPAPRQPPRRAKPAASVADDIGPGESGSRFAPVRRRASQAKLALVTTAVVVFGVGVAVTRLSYAGHSKRPLRSLAAPPGFVRIVRRNLLQAGIVAPAQAPPGAGTSVS
jgi:hypothetical protein